jgi:hypothetical protein
MSQHHLARFDKTWKCGGRVDDPVLGSSAQVTGHGRLWENPVSDQETR